MAITVAYALVEDDLFGILREEIAGATGETKVRRTQERRMVDGVQDGWIIGGESGTETEEVAIRRGGWKLYGKHEAPNGNVWRGVKMWSPRMGPVRTIADTYPSKMIGLMIHDQEVAPPWDENFTADQSLVTAVQLVAQFYDARSIEYTMPTTAPEAINFVLAHRAIGMEPVAGTTNRQIIRQGILPQLLR